MPCHDMPDHATPSHAPLSPDIDDLKHICRFGSSIRIWFFMLVVEIHLGVATTRDHVDVERREHILGHDPGGAWRRDGHVICG